MLQCKHQNTRTHSMPVSVENVYIKIKCMEYACKQANQKPTTEGDKRKTQTYRIAFTSGEFSRNPLWVIWLVEMKLFWFGNFDGAGLKSFNIVATGA